MRVELPSWLKEFKRRTSIIDIIADAFETGCSCSVCTKIRQVANEWGDMFLPPSTTGERR